jgi:hypothetical protein
MWERGAWVHLVVTHSAKSKSLFKNGVLAATTASHVSIRLAARRHAFLAKSAWSVDPLFHGSLALLRVWHGRELDLREVMALYADARDRPENLEQWHVRTLRVAEVVQLIAVGRSREARVEEEQEVRAAAARWPLKGDVSSQKLGRKGVYQK